MSKIFEALRKTEGDISEMARAVLGDEMPALPPLRDGKVATVEVPSPNPAVDRADGIRTVAVQLAPGSPLLPFHGVETHAARQYRIIRTKITNHPDHPKIILVSSPNAGDGKTLSAINLAAAFSLQEEVRVLLIDCDFGRSSAAKLLHMPTTPGTIDVLRNEATLEAALVRLDKFQNLYVMAPGDTSTNAAELLASPQWPALLEICRSEFDFVVLDAPPVGSTAEYELLQLACDGIVLVVRQDYTNRQLWKRALGTIPKSKQLGVVLNCAKKWFLWVHGYYYYSEKE